MKKCTKYILIFFIYLNKLFIIKTEGGNLMTEKEELQQYKQQIENMQQKLNQLSEQIDKLTINSESVVESQSTTSNEANKEQTVLSISTNRNGKQQRDSIKYEALENLIGKNLFAILASLLILIGVSIFISTIYTYIPEILKIAFIYLFGFAMLGVGLGIYKKNENKFWLAVGSCGLAELLVAIIASHSYFKILSLPITYLFILIWIIGSFKLTKIQPVLFKTIGYIGFMVSMTLGLDLIEYNDTIGYISLFVSYVVLSVFFMISNEDLNKTNALIAICSSFGLLFFRDYKWFSHFNSASNSWPWQMLLMLSILILISIFFNSLYAIKNKTKTGYTIHSILTLYLVLLFTDCLGDLTFPLLFASLLYLWSLNTILEFGRQNLFSIFACFYLLFWGNVSFPAFEWEHYGFLILMFVFYIHYYLKQEKSSAWLGIASFWTFMSIGSNIISDIMLELNYRFANNLSSEFYYEQLYNQTYWLILLIGISMALMLLFHSNKLKHDSILEISWYFSFISLICKLIELSIELLTNYYAWNNLWLEQLIENNIVAISIILISIFNTAYLHFAIKQGKSHSKVKWLLLPFQGLLLIQTLNILDYDGFCSMFGFLSSLLIVLYSVSYTIKTQNKQSRLILWQFLKFTWYISFVLSVWEASSIITNISLLILAIGAIVLGFKIQNRSIRLYGLIVSFINVISIVFSNVEWSNSLQLSFGIILCGLLCFGISFIYYKVSKHFENREAVISE